nr:hypothetical protein [uncultured Psychroserpens sp.]
MDIKSVLFSTLFLILSFSVKAQERTYEKLGNLILESVKKNDASLFKSLIIPEEAVWENFKKMYASEWTKEEEQQAFLDLPKNYKESVESDFMAKFLIMVTKAETFKLSFDSMAYEIVDDNDRFDKEMGVVRIYGTIGHPKFKYFSFGMINYKDKYYLVDTRVDISEVNKYSERNFLNNVILSENADGAIQSVGSLRLASHKSDSELFQCVVDNLILFGVEEIYVSEVIGSPSFIKGQWQFPYRINNSEDYIGTISYNFEYSLDNGVLTYTYSNYMHEKDNSKYKSLGILPLEYSASISKVFTQNEYYELLYDTEINLKLAIKRLKQSVDKCH